MNVLLAGVPRGGTTWAARVLARAQSATYVHEPDNPVTHPIALQAVLHLGQYPAPARDAVSGELEDLWGPILDASSPRWSRRLPPQEFRAKVARRLLKSRSDRVHRQLRAGKGVETRLRLAATLATPSPVVRGDVVVAKSVHAAFALEWIWERWHPSVLVLIRDPMNVVASWRSMGWEGPTPSRVLADREIHGWAQRNVDADPPPDDAPAVVRTAWFVLLLTTKIRQAALAHGWPIATHEDLCADPEAGFRALFDTLGLTWSDQVEAFLRWTDAEGSGYSVKRRRSDLREGWRQRMDGAEITLVEQVMSTFPG